MREIERLPFCLCQDFGPGTFRMNPQESTKRDAINEIFNQEIQAGVILAAISSAIVPVKVMLF